ncbi:MAG: RdgB/HAM1 family non-canonical purine NTP pyrophosphatase [Prevotellaceae bacterium]|jgi:XTP/dITP diphosphohydrolase|nr:RdgB/HAM1 family non-canonical purine NTP pyrophosphatase [Prevotellaceae bacterium]
MKLLFATNNSHKLSEVQQLLGGLYTLVTPADMGLTEDIPETQKTLEGNALQKASHIYGKLNVACFADDTGLEVDALNGAPGVHSARYSGSDKNLAKNVDKLLHELEGHTNRKACFRCVIALVDGEKEVLFEGRVDGEILLERSGTGGFGYDPVFRPDGYECSFAEMSAEEKNSISHRGKAIEKLVAYLREKPLSTL